MKKITNITESDINRLVKMVIKEEENTNVKTWFKRRKEVFILQLEGLINEEDPCTFGDEYEYAENIINWAMESSLDYDEYENFEYDLKDFLKEEFGEQLFDVYLDAGC